MLPSEPTQRPGLVSSINFDSCHIPEPLLIFGDDQTFTDPKLGLTLYDRLIAGEAKEADPTSIQVRAVVNYCVVKKDAFGKTRGRLPAELVELVGKLTDYKKVHQTFLDNFEHQAEKIINEAFPRTTNFWRSLKALAMQIPMPTQIMWP